MIQYYIMVLKSLILSLQTHHISGSEIMHLSLQRLIHLSLEKNIIKEMSAGDISKAQDMSSRCLKSGYTQCF